VTITERPVSAVQCILIQTVQHSANMLPTFHDVLGPTASLSSPSSIVPSTALDTARMCFSNRYDTDQRDWSNALESTTQMTVALLANDIIGPETEIAKVKSKITTDKIA